MNALSIRGLTKRYAEFALRDVSFSVGEGRIMGLIGKNGAGKSTTIKSVLNMVRPDAGTVEMLGRDFYANEGACKREIGVVLGGIDFYKLKKVRDITHVTRRFYPNWDDAAYEKYIRLFEIDPGKHVHQLSSGMKVKYLIALALSHHAKLLILDEPTSGLDPVSRDELLTLFQALVKGGHRSILFSTHITSDLDKCADDITYIANGEMLASAEKDAFAEHFEHLRRPGEAAPLTLEEIMIRQERRQYDLEFDL